MEIDPTELSRPDGKLSGLYEQFRQASDAQDRLKLFQRLMVKPAHSIHGASLKGRAMVSMMDNGELDAQAIAPMAGILAQCVADLAGEPEMPTLGTMQA